MKKIILCTIALVQAVIINCHKLGSLQIIDIYFSQFWRLEAWDQGTSMAVFWWELVQVTGFSSFYPPRAERVLPGVPFSKGTNPVHEGSIPWPNHLQRPHSLIPSHWALEFQHVNWWVQTRSIATIYNHPFYLTTQIKEITFKF